MKNLQLILIILFLIGSFEGNAQAIHLKNKYGSEIYFIDGKTLRANDRY